MEEMLKTLVSLGYIKGWYPDQEELIRNTQDMLISKLIPLGVPYTMENGEAVVQHGGFVFRLGRSSAKKYMAEDWYTYIFGPDPAPAVTAQTTPIAPIAPEGTGAIHINKGSDSFMKNFGSPAETMQQIEEPVQAAAVQNIPTPVSMERSMPKDEFTYTAVVFSHIGDGRVTNVKVMAAPIDDEKTLFWFNNGTGDFIEVGEGGVGIPILDKTCTIIRRQGTDKFRIDIRPQEGCKVEPRFGSGGEGGHIMFALDDARVHIIPKNYKQNKDGSANIICCVEMKNGQTFCLEGDVFEVNGRKYSLRSSWGSDRVLTVKIESM